MSGKSTITYSLREIGSEEPVAIPILTTECTKVPEVGEVIGIDTKIDRESLIIKYKDIKGESLQKWLRSDESQIQGNFVVVDVKRWFEVFHKPSTPSHLPIGLESSTTATNYRSFPEEYTVETFVVYIEPFRHTELTETPIAKLRNKMSPLYGYLQVVKAMRDKEIDSEQMGELFKEMQNQAIDSIEEIVEFMRNDKIWK